MRYKSNCFFLVDVDKASLFDGGPKSLVVVGFISQNEIPIHLAIGDGSMVFQPIEGNQVSSWTNLFIRLESKYFSFLTHHATKEYLLCFDGTHSSSSR